MGSDTDGFTIAYRDVRGFIERIEYPVVSAFGVYGSNVMSTVTAQIVVNGDPFFEARTYIEFEYIDSSEFPIGDEEYPAGKLLFEGEILSYQYVTSPVGDQ